jgi:hypothetical protein
MGVSVARPAWPQRIEKGQGAEVRAMELFRAARWSVLPYGEARPNAPVAPLQTPVGPIRPCDLAAYPPGGRPPYAVEVKQKEALTWLGGYGLDHSEDGAADCWKQLMLHDLYAGPVLLVIVDPVKDVVLCATVRMLSDPGPHLSGNGRVWYWPVDAFMPLAHFLRL